MTSVDAGMGDTEDPRIAAVAEAVRQRFGSGLDSPVALAGHRLIARQMLAAADAADAAAGIRRVTVEEWVEPSETEATAAMEAVRYLDLAESDLLDAVYDALRAAARVRIDGAS